MLYTVNYWQHHNVTPTENKFSVLHPKGSTQAQITELSPKPVDPSLFPHSIFPDHKLLILSYHLCQVLSSHKIVLTNKIYLFNNTVSISVYITYNVEAQKCGLIQGSILTLALRTELREVTKYLSHSMVIVPGEIHGQLHPHICHKHWSSSCQCNWDKETNTSYVCSLSRCTTLYEMFVNAEKQVWHVS